MVVITCKGMSLCGKAAHMVVTTCKGMSLVERRETWS